jgi:hypothetical protein
MAHSLQGCCTHANFCHAAKGTGYCMGAAGASLALLTLSVIVTAVALSLFAWDGLFLYSVGAQTPLHLLWAIPVTLVFIAIDLLIILRVAKIGTIISDILKQRAVYCGKMMLEHYRAISLTTALQ